MHSGDTRIEEIVMGDLYHGTWPSGIPRLYPDLSDLKISQIMSRELYGRIKKFPLVMVTPFVSEDDTGSDLAFGLGFSRVLIRDLMTVRNISVRGPEDTPMIDTGSVPALSGQDDKTTYVTGFVTRGHGSYQADIQAWRAGELIDADTVQGTDLVEFIQSCDEAIVAMVGGKVTESIRKMWTSGRPGSDEILQAFGSVLAQAESEEDEEVSEQMLELAWKDRDFILPVHHIDMKQHLNLVLTALERDPFDAQLCFLLFTGVWDSSGPQPEAVQFLRRCLTISQGHGKAHMCAPHAAHAAVDMRLHSELGVRLLPGNAFAINNFILYAQEAGETPDRIVPLARMAVDCDPYDPNGYERLMDLYIELDDYEQAIEIAVRKLELFEPEPNERAIYCLQQNPAMAEMLQEGFDPAEWTRDQIRELCEEGGYSPDDWGIESEEWGTDPDRSKKKRRRRKKRRKNSGGCLPMIAILAVGFSFLLVILLGVPVCAL